MGKHKPNYFKEYARKNKDRLRKYQRDAKRKRLSEGKCVHCSREHMPNSNSFCKKHWFINVSGSRLGCYTLKGGLFLEQLFKSQEGKCFYTGWEITPGINAELDHTLATNTHPQHKNTKDNVQWVHSYVNKMKRDIPVETFFSVCEAITAKLKKPGLTGT